MQSQFQSFAAQGGPEKGAERLAALRAELERRGLTGFVVPRADEHQNEYVPASAERLLWLTGFSGSAGLAIVLRDKAALFVDGRYTVQAAQQIDTALIRPIQIAETSPVLWLERNLLPEDRLGFDPWLQTPETSDRFSRACAATGAELVAVDSNPVDAVWHDRPEPPLGLIRGFNEELAGESAVAKIRRVQNELQRVEGLVVSDAHNIAWLLNIRGSDVSYTPLPLCFAYVPRAGEPTIFVDHRKLANDLHRRLSELVSVEEPARLQEFVEGLGSKKARVLFDGATIATRLVRAFRDRGGDAQVTQDPITLIKAKKNSLELAGVRQAHLRDGVAMVRFLAWFDDEAPRGKLTEISAAVALERFRAESGALKDLSFPTIAAAGPHAAIPHYRVSESSDLAIGKGFFLIDSGA